MTEEGGFFSWIWGWFWPTDENEEVAPEPPTRVRDKDVERLLAKHPSDTFLFENIAFEGGGMKALAHAGGLRVGSACNIMSYRGRSGKIARPLRSRFAYYYNTRSSRRDQCISLSHSIACEPKSVNFKKQKGGSLDFGRI